MIDDHVTGGEDGRVYGEGMNNALQINRSFLSLVPTMSSEERSLIARRPVATCVAAACAGDFWAHMDNQLVQFLLANVNGSPLVEVSAPTNPTDQAAPAVLRGTARVITAGSRIADIWASPTGALERSYQEGAAAGAQAWGDVITDRMYSWVGSWIRSVVGPCSRARFAEIRDKVFDSLQSISLSEWEWERSRRSMTFGQLRAAIEQHASRRNSMED